MGPLANARRIEAMEGFVADAEAKGAKLRTGGERIGNQGFFFEPTVLTDVPLDARIMNEEPFGPIAAINRFADEEEAIAEANRLPYGLAAYAFTRSAETPDASSRPRVESGMISINHHGLALPEVPFGGVKDSGYGSEGGARGDRGLPQHEVRDAGGGLSASPARGRGRLGGQRRPGEGSSSPVACDGGGGPCEAWWRGRPQARCVGLPPPPPHRPEPTFGGPPPRFAGEDRRDAHHRRRFPASSSGFCRVMVGALPTKADRKMFHVKHRPAGAPSAMPRMAACPAHAGEDGRRHRKSAALYRSDSSLGR